MDETREVVIVTQFGGKCRGCGDFIAPGAKVYWTPSLGIRHLNPEDCHCVNDARSDDEFFQDASEWGDL